MRWDYMTQERKSIDDATPEEWAAVQKKLYSEMKVEPLVPRPKDLIDDVNKPQHYNSGTIECIEYIKDSAESVAHYEGYLAGNVKKYLHRCPYKNKKLQDLQKARWYLDKWIEVVSGK